MLRNSWIHIPQSYCGRIESRDEMPTTGLCTFEFTSCHIVVIIHKTTHTTRASLLHLDGFNHLSIIREELEHYEALDPNGNHEICIFKRQNVSPVVTNKILGQMKREKLKYKLVSLENNTLVQGISVSKKGKIDFITNSKYNQILGETSLESDFNLIKHPDEWQLLLERRIISRITNIKLQNVWTPYVIYDGFHWLDILKQNKSNIIINKDAKMIYKKFQQFMSSFTFDSNVYNITEKMMMMMMSSSSSSSINIHEAGLFVALGAISAKILKGFQTYKNRNYVLTQIIHENCKSVLTDIPNLSKIEKNEIISYCNHLISINDIQKMNKTQTIKTFKNYKELVYFEFLFGEQLNRYIDAQRRKKHMAVYEEYGKIGFDCFASSDWCNAKKYYWANIINARYLCYTPSHELAKACYNYGACCQNANQRNNAVSYLTIAYGINTELENSNQTHAREKKILRRLKQLGKTTPPGF